MSAILEMDRQRQHQRLGEPLLERLKRRATRLI
jgi:hypothetical protein